MATWQLLVGPSTSTPTAQLTRAKSRKFTFNLESPSSAGFTIDGRSAEAGKVVELGTDLHLLRDAVPLYTGRIMSSSEDFGDEGHSLQASSADTRGLLTRRLLNADTTLSGDASAVAAQLLSAAQSAPNTSLNVTVPTFPATGVQVTRQAKAGASIYAELAAIAGGTDTTASAFDWDISPGWVGGPSGNPRARLWAPSRGRDLTGAGGVVLDYTYRTLGGRLVPRSSPVAKVTRAFDPATYANVYTASGGTFRATYTFPAAAAYESLDTVRRGFDGQPVNITKTTFDEGNKKTQLDGRTTFDVEIPTTPVTLSDGSTAWDIGTYGAYEAYSDVTSQAELNRLAVARAADLRSFTPTYTVTLKDRWWQGPEHIWLGDTIRLILNTGRLDEDVALRVTALELTLGDNGEESVALTVGPTRRDELSTLLAHARRLQALERA